MTAKQYPRYIIALDNFGHDSNGNPIARHTVYGTNDTSAERATADKLDAGDFGGPMLYQQRRRSQVGYSSYRNDSAPDVLRKAGGQNIPRLYSVERVLDRSAGTMYLVYTHPETSAEMRRRLAGVAVGLLAKLEAGADKAAATLEAYPDARDRTELFFLLDNLHPDRMVALRMVVDAYTNGTPLPKVGGVTLF